MAPKRKNNQDSEAASQAKRARMAPTANVVNENSPQQNVVVGRNPGPTQPPFGVPATIKWPDAPPNSKGFRSIVQTTIRRTGEELGLPPGVPAPILAIPSAPGIPTRPDCKIAFPDLVLPTGARPSWEEQLGPRFPSSSFSPILSRPRSSPALAPGAGSSMPQMRRTSSTASLSSQVPSSSRLFIPRPAAQSDKITTAPKTKAAPPHPFMRRVPRPIPPSQPLPATAQPPAPQPASQPAPPSQILNPAQNSPILHHEPTPSFIDSSHHSPPSKVPSNPISLRGENAMISPVGAASPPPPVAHSPPPQPRPVQASHQPRSYHSPPNAPSNPIPLSRENTMPLGAVSPPPPVPQMAHSPPPQPRPAQFSPQPRPAQFSPQPRPVQFSPQPRPVQFSPQSNPAFAASPPQVPQRLPPQPRPAQVSPQLNPAFATSPPRVPQGLPPQPRPIRREETMIWPSSFGNQPQAPVSHGAHSPPQPNPAHAARPLPTRGQVGSQAPTRPMHPLPQRPGPIPTPMQSVQQNNNRASQHGGSRQPYARGPSYAQPPRPQQQQQQYRAPPPSASYHPGPPQRQQQYHVPPPSTSYHPGQRQYQGGYNLNQQMHNTNYNPGAPSGAQTPYTQIPPNHPPYPAPAQEYNPTRPNFMNNNFGAGNQPGYPQSYTGQPPPGNNGGYNGGWR